MTKVQRDPGTLGPQVTDVEFLACARAACGTCHGTGRIRAAIPAGTPMRALACPCAKRRFFKANGRRVAFHPAPPHQLHWVKE